MTENNHLSVLGIISIVGLVISTIVIFARAIVRWHVLGPEDFVLVAAQVLAFGQYAALFVSLHYGLGRSSELVTLHSQDIISKAAFSSQILTIFSLGLSKCSVVLTIRRLFAPYHKSCWLICNYLVAVFCVWLVGGVVLVSVGCDVEKYIPPKADETCAAFPARWNVINALDVISELAMLGLPLYFLVPLEIDHQHKMRVALAFVLRLPVTAFVIAFSVLFTLANFSPVRSTIITTALLWQQLELSYSLVSTTLPCLCWFSGSLFTFENNPSSNDSYRARSNGLSKPSHSHSRTQSESHIQKHIDGVMGTKESLVQAAINLTTLRPKEVERNVGYAQHHVGRLRPERLNSKTVISGGIRSRSQDSARSRAGSQELIIRRDVRFLVENHCANKRSSVHSEGGHQ